MKVDRNTDARHTHGRPDDWWQRVNWDYKMMTKQERIERGQRNLRIAGQVSLAVILIGFITLLAVGSGSVILALVVVAFIFGRSR